MLSEKQIDQLESHPKRLSVGFEKRHTGWWDESFKKSANEHYSAGHKYFYNCSYKAIGKTVTWLLAKLKAKCKNAHRSFKIAVNELIESDLITRYYRDNIYSGYKLKNRHVYVDDQGIVQNYINTVTDRCSLLHSETSLSSLYPQYKGIARHIWHLEDLKSNTKVLEYYHCMYPYMVRYKGLHYYVTNTTLEDIALRTRFLPRLDASHYNVIENVKKILCLSKMSPQELKYHGLIDIKENPLKNLDKKLKGKYNANLEINC